jgi:retron-type reverse transcriptase
MAALYEALRSFDNLLAAFRQASKGKRGQPGVAAFEHRLEDELLALQAELRGETYRPGPYASFHIHEPKRRLISAAPFRDRVVHHALCNLTQPLLERGFIADSYANRVGKGTHRALARCQYFARRYPYAMACDIRQYFPSIDHAILRAILARKVRDPAVMGLIDRILAGGAGLLVDEYHMVYFAGDDLLAALRPRGLPIGNLTSQLWANAYLDGFDHFVKRELRVRGYVRYVDDFLFFAEDKPALRAWKSRLETRLADLRLTLHAGAGPRPVTEGVPFLGFVVYPDRRRLKRRKGIHFRRRLRALASACRAGRLPRAALAASIRGWVNHARHGNTVGLRKAVFREVFGGMGRRSRII